MSKAIESAGFSARRAGAIALAAVVACSLSFPHLAFASVRVDDTELAQGENTIGGGTATLSSATLDMAGVKAYDFFTDESLAINFNGGNSIDQTVIGGAADVAMSFKDENAVEDIVATENSKVTINADGHNGFEEVSALQDSSVTVNVTGENDFESIEATDNASITVRGTGCQKRDEINLGEGETNACLITLKGDMTIDHVTVNLESKFADVGSDEGNVSIDTSKIAKGDDNEYASIVAGGTMDVRESVIDIAGIVSSAGEMTIEHSDMKVEKPAGKYDDKTPYRIYSKTGIKLIGEKNGKVKEGTAFGDKVWFVDTDDNEGVDVDLKADGQPAYYRCAGEDTAQAQVTALPRTGDANSPFLPLAAGIASIATAAYAARKRVEG